MFTIFSDSDSHSRSAVAEKSATLISASQMAPMLNNNNDNNNNNSNNSNNNNDNNNINLALLHFLRPCRELRHSHLSIADGAGAEQQQQ